MSDEKTAHDNNDNELLNEDEIMNESSEELEVDATGNNEDRLEQLEKQVVELNDKYVRSQAEMQNLHRRHQDEQKKTREYAISSFAKELVAVKDYLEMALKDETGNFEMLKMGVDLTLKQLVQVFEGQKITEVTPKAGDKLDPHKHQAMNTVESEGQEPNTIISVMQKGYVLHDRVLRPAMVTVAK